MRADRLLSILMLLQVHRHLTAGELSRRLEVSERTILRDMDALSLSGIPVLASRGRGGGWRLLEPFRTNLTGLNIDEISALFLDAPESLLSDLGLRQASEAAAIKLLAAMPTAQRQRAETARQRIHVDPSGWHGCADEVPALPGLQEAVWQDRSVRLHYRRGGEEETVERLLDPLGLVAKGSSWYLVGRTDDSIRTYRVSRIAGVELLTETFERPEGFDLAGYWAESSARFVAHLPRYTMTARFDPAVVDRLRHGARFVQAEPLDGDDPEGWVRMRLTFQFEQEAAGFILSFGGRCQVVEPPELGSLVRELAHDTLTLARIRA